MAAHCTLAHKLANGSDDGSQSGYVAYEYAFINKITHQHAIK
jgi:hypothetical protein